jgi:hypothetical protein
MILASRAASRFVLAGCAVGLAALAIALPGCGSDTPAKAGGASVSSAEAGKEPKLLKPAASKAATVDKRCRGQLAGFIDTMDALRERLASGLSYEEYVGEISVVRASYDEVPVDQLTLPCLAGAGTPGERAFGAYIAAANAWGGCIEEAGCDAATIEPVLQKEWRRASRQLDRAQAGLGA